MIIYLLDRYTGDGTEQNPNRPAIVDLYFGDNVIITDKPTSPSADCIVPDPNAVVVEIICDESVISSIENNTDYGVGAILYDLPNPYSPDGKPDANEYGKRRSYAARLGISNAQFRAMFGEPGNPKNRKDGADNLINWVRTLPKWAGEFYVQFVTSPSYTPATIDMGQIKTITAADGTVIMEAEINAATLDAWLSDKKIHILFYEAR